MEFEIKNKVALVTGGASGIGLKCIKELLKNEIKVCILINLRSKSKK